ncbi:MAG: hypothetical protein HKO90_05095, partial [Flavobacteriaceae bacterium]|nr:hypothetical protein [Flavobacteriaceae bacterium]
MRILIITLFISILGSAQAQRNYLAIYTDASEFGAIMFPPGTPFELYDWDNNLVLNQDSFEGIFAIDDPHTLYVFPSWKEEKEVFKLENARIEVLPTKNYHKSGIKHTPISSHGITVTKSVTDSAVNPGEKNVKLEFSNGILFTYTDGDVEATLNGKILEIENKYLVYSQLGVTK